MTVVVVLIARTSGNDTSFRLTFRLLILGFRFQRKLYASFHIVQTDMKGFGLRAAVDFPKSVYATPPLSSGTEILSSETLLSMSILARLSVIRRS